MRIVLFLLAGVSVSSGVLANALSQISLGSAHTCVVDTEGAVRCWGHNGRGQLGLEDTRPRGVSPEEMGAALPAVALGAPAVAVATGSAHSCALLRDGRVKCWGANEHGQLGLGDKAPRGHAPGTMGSALPAVGLGQIARAVFAGAQRTCAVLVDSSLRCWGDNRFGQLGVEDTNDRGDEADEMGMKLPAVRLPSTERIVAMGFNNNATCALDRAGAVYCWGLNDHGILGRGDDVSVGGAPNTMGFKLKAVPLGTNIATRISASEASFCAVTRDGAVRCWGDNSHCTLATGQGFDTTIGTSPESLNGGVPRIPLGDGVLADGIACGRYHCCARLKGGYLRCWGRSTNGQLGMQDSFVGCFGDGPEDFAPVSLGTGTTVPAIFSGAEHTCATVNNGSSVGLKCWGSNTFGQLGVGDRKNRGARPQDMGDVLPFVKWKEGVR